MALFNESTGVYAHPDDEWQRYYTEGLGLPFGYILIDSPGWHSTMDTSGSINLLGNNVVEYDYGYSSYQNASPVLLATLEYLGLGTKPVQGLSHSGWNFHDEDLVKFVEGLERLDKVEGTEIAL